MSLFKIYLENKNRLNLMASASLFYILSTTNKELNVPLSKKILGSLIKQNKRNVFFHICSEQNALKVINMQGLKTKPLSCFIKTNKTLLSEGVKETDSDDYDYILVLKGTSLSDFNRDIYSSVDHYGSYRMVPLKQFKLNKQKEIEIEFENFINKFINNNKQKIIKFIKEITDYNFPFQDLIKDLKKNINIPIIFRNKLFYELDDITTKESGILKRDFIKECIDFWTKIISKYKIYETFKGNYTDYTESLIVNYKIIEILSCVEDEFYDKDYKFKYFDSISKLQKYINNYKEKI